MDKDKNYFKKKNEIEELLLELSGNYDLPEHPDQMNGFSNTSEVAEKILAKVGISKPKQGEQ